MPSNPLSPFPPVHSPKTLPEGLFEALAEARWVRTKKEFALLVDVDEGNIYNYLASISKKNRIAATGDTLRRWGRKVTDGTAGAVRVCVTQDEHGTCELLVEGCDREGRPFGPKRYLAPEPEIGTRGPRGRRPNTTSNHDRAPEPGQAACNAVTAALAVFRPVTGSRTGSCCAVAHGGDGASIVHTCGSESLRVVVVPVLANAALVREALDEEGVALDVGTLDAPQRLVSLYVGPAGLLPMQAARVIARLLGWWEPRRAPPAILLAEEVPGTFREGNRTQVSVNRYERDPRARQACIAHHGSKCAVCDLSYPDIYAPLGAGFIHVHHIEALHETGVEHEVDPEVDLRPVCASCHAMLHWDSPPRSIAELRVIVARNRDRMARREPVDAVESGSTRSSMTATLEGLSSPG